MQTTVPNLRAWAADKPPALTVFALQLVPNIDALIDGIIFARSGQIAHALAEPKDLKEWFRLYRDHRRVREAVWRVSEAAGVPVLCTLDDLDAFREGLREVMRMGPEGIKQTLESMPADNMRELLTACVEGVRRLLEMQFEQVSSEIQSEGFDDEQMDIVGNVAEFRFLLLVHVRCWIEAETDPVVLYRRARHYVRGVGGEREFDAFDTLLRIDKSFVSDPYFAPWFHAQAAKRSTAYEMAMTALRGEPKKSIERRAIKASLGGLLSAFAESIQHPLTTPQVRALFDAMARDRGLGERDADLPEGDEAWQKAVVRARRAWSIPKADKTHS